MAAFKCLAITVALKKAACVGIGATIGWLFAHEVTKKVIPKPKDEALKDTIKNIRIVNRQLSSMLSQLGYLKILFEDIIEASNSGENINVDALA